MKGMVSVRVPTFFASAWKLVSLFAAIALFAGCGGTPSILQGSTATPASSKLKGKVAGGQQPVSRATIQLYAVGTAGDATTATPLIATTFTTSDGTGQMNSNANAGNANNSLPAGSFTISGDYTCPSASSEVYFVATGGNPGLVTGTNNSAISLMAALGQCGNLSSSTVVVVNELTTISTIASLSSFMSSYANVGSGPSDAAQLQSALSLVNEYADVSSGTVPGPALPTGYSASSTAIQTLGDIVASCVNSAGGVAGDGSPCGKLFTLATTSGSSAPTDTVGAILNILNQPTINVAQIDALLSANGPFQPTLLTAPANWGLPITSNTATQLVFTVPPSNSAAGDSILPAVAVAVEDASGNTQTLATNTVTLAIGANSGSGTLNGATTVSAVNGVATFPNLSIDNVGTGYTLTADSTGLPVAISAPFSVASHVTTITSASSTVSSTSPVVELTNVISVDFTGQSALFGQTVSVAQVVDADLNALASDRQIDLDTDLSDPNTIQITTPVPPAGDLAATVDATSAISGATAGQAVTAYVYSAAGDSGDGEDTFEALPATVDTTADTITVNVPGDYFLPVGDGTYVADLKIGVATTYSTPSLQAAQDFHLAGLATGRYTPASAPQVALSLPCPVAPNPCIERSRWNPKRYLGGVYRPHYGVDFVASVGTPIYVPLNGLPQHAYTQYQYNTCVSTGAGCFIDPACSRGFSPSCINGRAGIVLGVHYVQGFTLRLLHLSSCARGQTSLCGIAASLLSNGNLVTNIPTTTSAVAYSGNTGAALTAGPHLHYEVIAANTRVCAPSASSCQYVMSRSGNVNTDPFPLIATQLSLQNLTSLPYISPGGNYLFNLVATDLNGVAVSSSVQSPGENGGTPPVSGQQPPGFVYDPTRKNCLDSNFVGAVQFTPSPDSLTIFDGIDFGFSASPSYCAPWGTSVSAYVPTPSSAPTFVTVKFSSDPTQPVASDPLSTLSAAYPSGFIFTVAGGGSNYPSVGGGSGQATSYSLTGPVSVAVDSIGNFYISGAYDGPVSEVTPLGELSVIPVNTTGVYGIYTEGIAFDSSGNLYIAFPAGQVIGEITPSGVQSTVAGNGTVTNIGAPPYDVGGYSGDGGLATSAELNNPYGVAVDSGGNLYIADTYNAVIRKVTAATGDISTYAGSGILRFPVGVAVDSSWNVYIADEYYNSIFEVTPAGVISRVAGDGVPGTNTSCVYGACTGNYGGDGGLATSAQLDGPSGVAVDNSGNIYIADTYNNVIRKVTAATGIISTVAGNGTGRGPIQYSGPSYFSGDGGPATSAELNHPYGVALDASGNIYIADTYNNRIRMVTH